MSSDGTSTPDDTHDEAERFAAALDGCGDGPVEGDPDVARDVALARRLGTLGSSLDPEPQARERARQRLLAALDREADAGGNGPSRAS